MLVLFHFAGNAFLRTYQLLVSPSIVAYMIRDQFYHPVKSTSKPMSASQKKWFLMGLMEFNMDSFLSDKLFKPLKQLGHRLDFLTYRNLLLFFVPFYAVSLLLFVYQESLPEQVKYFMPATYGFIAVMMVMKAFSERKYPRLAFLLVLMSHLWISLAVAFNDDFDKREILIYLSGMIPGGLIGWYCLQQLKNKHPLHFDLNQFYGYARLYPVLALVYLISVLSIMGFPISPTFIGIDLIFSHIRSGDYLLGLFNSLTFASNSLILSTFVFD
jgi:formate hydrogenlyase subunit 3/multisubunit Na+/H+ antiporter MnhD subunit